MKVFDASRKSSNENLYE